MTWNRSEGGISAWKSTGFPAVEAKMLHRLKAAFVGHFRAFRDPVSKIEVLEIGALGPVK
jgi:hypothetical protein